MEELRKPFFIAACVLFGLVVLIELGAHFFVPHPTPDRIAHAMCTSDSPPPECGLPGGLGEQVLVGEISGNQEPARPGLGISYLALVDAVVLFALFLIASSLIVPASIEGRVQGCATLIFSIVLVLLSIVLIFVAFGDVILMISLLLSFPFGTIAYMIIYGFFDRGGAGVTLSLIMLLKIAGAVCLVLAQQRFLQNIGFVIIIAASLVASVVVAFLQGLPPGFLVSITDAIAAIIVGIIAVIALILLLVGSIPAIIKALNPAG